jgi:nitrous oxide reductase
MTEKTPKTSPARRKFLGQAGAAALAAGAVGLKPALGGRGAVAEAAPGGSNPNSGVANRANDSFNYRMKMAQDEKVNAGKQADNGDLARYTDFSGVYTKGLAHDALGVPNAASVRSLLKAFQKIGRAHV